jgi:hypothetical protein
VISSPFILLLHLTVLLFLRRVLGAVQSLQTACCPHPTHSMDRGKSGRSMAERQMREAETADDCSSLGSVQTFQDSVWRL